MAVLREPIPYDEARKFFNFDENVSENVVIEWLLASMQGLIIESEYVTGEELLTFLENERRTRPARDFYHDVHFKQD